MKIGPMGTITAPMVAGSRVQPNLPDSAWYVFLSFLQFKVLLFMNTSV